MTRRRRSQGIGALDDDDLLEPDAAGESGAEGGEGDGEGDGEGGARLVWSEHAHGGAVNCLAARGDLLASASRCGPAGGGRERPRGSHGIGWRFGSQGSRGKYVFSKYLIRMTYVLIKLSTRVLC